MRRGRRAANGSVRAAALAAALALAVPARSAGPEVVDPEVTLASPSTDQPVSGDRPLIRVQVQGGRTAALLLLDGVDVTALAERASGELRWRVDRRLPPGPHRVKVVMVDPEGRSELGWTFTVAAGPGEGGPGSALHARGALSLSGSRSVADGGGSSRAGATGSLGLGAGAARGSLEAGLAGSLSWVSSGPGPQLVPGGWVASVKRGPDSIAFGDVSVAGTSFTAPTLARRGLLLTLQHFDSTLQAFQVGSRAVRGLDAGVRFADQADQLYGGSVRTSLLAGQPLQLGVAFLQGRSASGSSYNVASAFAGPTEGRALGFSLAGTLLGTSLSAEGALSDYRGAPDGGSQRDGAASLRLGHSLGPLNLSAAWERIGPDFASIASPGASRDRQQVAFSAAAPLGPASLAATLARASDNLGRAPGRPVVVSTSGGATLGLAGSGRPSLTLAYLRGLLRAEQLPPGHPGADSATDTASASLSWTAGPYAVGLSSAFSWLDDRRPDGQATIATRSFQLSASARPGPRLGVAPSLARAETRTGSLLRTTDLAALALDLALVPRSLSLAGQGSYGSSRASDGSARADQWGGALRLAWQLHRLWEPWAGLGSTVVAASGHYSRARDRGPQPMVSETWAALVSLDLALPFEARSGP